MTVTFTASRKTLNRLYVSLVIAISIIAIPATFFLLNNKQMVVAGAVILAYGIAVHVLNFYAQKNRQR